MFVGDLAVEHDAAIEVLGVGDVCDSELAELGDGVAEHLDDRRVRLDHACHVVETQETDRSAVEDLAEAAQGLELDALDSSAAALLSAAESKTESSPRMRASSSPNQWESAATAMRTPIDRSPRSNGTPRPRPSASSPTIALSWRNVAPNVLPRIGTVSPTFDSNEPVPAA